MKSQLFQAIEVLKQGGVIIFPSDTVWGIGALLSSAKGIQRFYQFKVRESAKPSQVLVANLDIAKRYGDFSVSARRLAHKYWPGALTLVTNANVKTVPESIRHGRQTVGLRVPDHMLCKQLLEELGEGLVASSANVSGGTAPLHFDQIETGLLEQVDFVVSGDAGGKTSSTVVDITQDPPQVLRQGDIKLIE